MLLWFAVGILVGAVFALLMAPSSGKRTRALLSDKANKAKHDLGDSASSKLENVKESAQGAYVGAVNSLESDVETTNDVLDDGDDALIADRVRTALGENDLTRDLERLNVDSCQGVVTLRGFLPAGISEQVVTMVRTIQGVRDAVLETTSESDSAPFVG